MPNYDVLEDKAGYLGTRITTKAPSQQFKDGWDRIFGQKQKEVKQDAVVKDDEKRG